VPAQPRRGRKPAQARARRDLPPQARGRGLQGPEEVKKKVAIPRAKANGRKIACIGAGPASLTVARDLAPLGYDVTVFDQDHRAGGMIWTQIPRFRLPMEVIDEEVGYILDLGVSFKQRKIESMKQLLGEGYDAIFVGSGAPRGRDLDIPGRKEGAANIHIGIDWLSSVSFGHTSKIGKKVIVLGGGNTAMDCCRTSKRIGGEDVKVIVRSGFEEMKASPWEKEDAQHEGIPILNYLVPKSFVIQKRKARRDDLRESEGRLRRQGTPQPRPDRRARPELRVRRRAGRGRPGERLPVDRARLGDHVRQMGFTSFR
jgi:NADPH-dependent glutamate synthase beta subunit-like oxidoreductase